MAVVTPESWDDAGLATAHPSDAAPLLAIAYALQERAAVAPGVSLQFAPGDALRYTTLEALRRILASIRSLQGSFISHYRNYAATYWTDYPEKLAATQDAPRPNVGLRPWDALAVDPPPVTPQPGDDDWRVQDYRAFLAWARRALGAMHVVEAVQAWSFGIYTGNTDPPANYTAGTSDLHFTAEWGNNNGAWEFGLSQIPAGLVVSNEYGLDAVAGVVMAGFYPNGTQYDPTVHAWSGNAAWFAGTLGPISRTVQAPAYSTATLLGAGETAVASGAALPSGTGGDICVMRAKLVPFLDFTDSFRFP